MRFWVLTLLPLSTLAAQLPFHSTSTTLVDALSADDDYSSLLRLLQRARLIPTLNKLNGSTLFAPTNDAISRHPSCNNALQDNIHEQLRQDLFYHILNYSIHALPTQLPEVQVHKTLLFPHTTHVDSPWFPVPGGTLGG